MSIDEMIKHCEEVADAQESYASQYDERDAYESWEKSLCESCAEEHRQLVEWLTEYKKLKEVIGKIDKQIHSDNRNTCDYFIVDKVEEIINRLKTEGLV